MMNSKAIVLFFAASLLFVWGCEKGEEPEPTGGTNTGVPTPTGTVSFIISGNHDGQPLEMTPTEYNNISNYRVRYETVEFYLSHLELDNGNGAFEVNDYAYIDLRDGADTLVVTVPTGTYSGANFGLGVPPDVNLVVDPATYPGDHPLSINNLMYWTWSSGYKFFQMDAKADTSAAGNGPFDTNIIFHTGADTLYQTLNFNGLMVDVPDGGNVNVNIEFNAARTMYSASDTIDLNIDYATHTADNLPLAQRVSANLAEAFTVY